MAKSKFSKQEKVNLDETIGKNIRSERQARNLSRDELAEMLDLTTSHMGLIERGERGATAVTLSKLARVLQMPIDNFFALEQAAMVREERDNAKTAAKRKINSLITNLDETELALVVHMIQGVHKLSVANKED